MRIVIVTILVFLWTASEAKYYSLYGFTESYLSISQIYARSSALGKGGVALMGNLHAIYHNPAGISNMEGISLTGGLANPLIFSNNGELVSFGAAYRIKNLMTLGLAVNKVTYGENFIATDIIDIDPSSAISNQFVILDTFKPAYSNFYLTIASEPFKNFHIGVNTKIHTWKEHTNRLYRQLTFDIGILKKFNLHKSEKAIHDLTAGLSLTNFIFGNSIVLDEYRNPVSLRIPSGSKIGLSYHLGLSKNMITSKLNILDVLFHTEYGVYSFPFSPALRLGIELTTLEIISLRWGYSYSNQRGYTFNQNGLLDSRRNELNEFTYGLGLQLPIDKLTESKYPITFKMNYARIPNDIMIYNEQSISSTPLNNKYYNTFDFID